MFAYISYLHQTHLERELTEALSMSQKKSAMEYDLMQSNLTELLIESNKKIKALESANSILRYELQNSKNRNNIKENPKNETVSNCFVLKLNLIFCL